MFPVTAFAAGDRPIQHGHVRTKTFFFPSRPRGKFQGMPILHPAMLERRRWLVPACAAITLAVLACIAVAP